MKMPKIETPVVLSVVVGVMLFGAAIYFARKAAPNNETVKKAIDVVTGTPTP